MREKAQCKREVDKQYGMAVLGCAECFPASVLREAALTIGFAGRCFSSEPTVGCQRAGGFSRAVAIHAF